MNPRTQAIVLIFVNATAAAASFVGSILLTAQLNFTPGFVGLAVGLLGLGYFVKQAEAQRAKLRCRQT
jgi:hypothetical protein